MRPTVEIKRLRPGGLPPPRYQTPHAAGFDLVADLEESLTLVPMARAAVPTGIAIAIPTGFEGQIRPRSGRALSEGLTVINSPGTIDADYRGEVKVLLVNLGPAPVVIGRGDRIAQLVVSPVVQAEIVEVEELHGTLRGDGGFGHTGR